MNMREEEKKQEGEKGKIVESVGVRRGGNTQKKKKKGRRPEEKQKNKTRKNKNQKDETNTKRKRTKREKGRMKRVVLGCMSGARGRKREGCVKRKRRKRWWCYVY